jgi:hypothetical protein
MDENISTLSTYNNQHKKTHTIAKEFALIFFHQIVSCPVGSKEQNLVV